MGDLLQIRVTGEMLAELFTNGDKHYEVINGLPPEYTFRGAMRDPFGPGWVLSFKADVPKENNELIPTFKFKVD